LFFFDNKTSASQEIKHRSIFFFDNKTSSSHANSGGSIRLNNKTVTSFKCGNFKKLGNKQKGF